MNDHDQLKLEGEELQWWAYRYLDDLLSPEDRSSFEKLLSENQVAREAVASGVELIGAIVKSQSAPRLSKQSSKPFSWRTASSLALSLCLCLLVMVTLQFLIFSTSSPPPAGATDQKNTVPETQVAEIFFNLNAAEVGVELAENTEETVDLVDIEDESENQFDLQDNWYLAAIELDNSDRMPEE